MQTWIEQAKFMLMNCECSEKEKRKQIVESSAVFQLGSQRT